MKHNDVIEGLEVELSGIEVDIEDSQKTLLDPLKTRRDANKNLEVIIKCEKSAEQYKSAIKILKMYDSLKY